MRRRHVIGAGEREEVIAAIRSVLAGLDGVEVGYVFGSFCRGEFADVDVAVLVAGEPSPYQAMRFARMIERELERALSHRFEVDAKVLNTAPIAFQHEVVKSGRPVFFRDRGRQIRYEADLLSRYLDYRDTLEWFDRVLLTRA
ncbi:nucleotidyltransferase domain-containing protein [Methanoculleus sp. FWC-SCC1]|uniref:Nucleotidyltransferase domain-containing protein n=2 Tax=Methanoculleus frigidifontis TaxID=2584085 RepID=A0ABT8M7B9_9EURY|nr:nucleotidyltransferase domain-containing protein [Methanoculleus sp. FWC-SCC1]